MPERNLAYYVTALTTLKQDRSGVPTNGFAAPHMPILVLSLIQGFEQGILADERIYLSPELISLFTSNWASLVKTGSYHPLIAQPFYHLKSRGNFPLWWHLIPRPGCEIWIENGGSMRSIRNLTTAIEYAELDTDLAVLLTDTQSRRRLRQAVLSTYFPDQADIDLDSISNHFDEVSQQIVNENPVRI